MASYSLLKNATVNCLVVGTHISELFKECDDNDPFGTSDKYNLYSKKDHKVTSSDIFQHTFSSATAFGSMALYEYIMIPLKTHTRWILVVLIPVIYDSGELCGCDGPEKCSHWELVHYDWCDQFVFSEFSIPYHSLYYLIACLFMYVYMYSAPRSNTPREIDQVENYLFDTFQV